MEFTTWNAPERETRDSLTDLVAFLEVVIRDMLGGMIS